MEDKPTVSKTNLPPNQKYIIPAMILDPERTLDRKIIRFCRKNMIPLIVKSNEEIDKINQVVTNR